MIHDLPYTDMHELNLDWFLEEFKKYYEKVISQDQKITTLEETVEQFTSFVTNYFDNLDVQQEINNKLDAMVEDGTMTALIQPLFDSYTITINNRMDTQDDDIDVLDARITALATLTEGSTTGDAELIDARTGFDGITSANAGDSIRRQAGNQNLISQMLTENKGTFLGKGHFQNYGLKNDGTFDSSIRYRISCNNTISFDRDIMVTVKYGFRWGYIPFESGTPGTWSGWYDRTNGRIIIPANTEFRVQIARLYSLEDPTESADVQEFVSQISFEPVIYDKLVDKMAYTFRELQNDSLKVMNIANGLPNNTGNSQCIRTVDGYPVNNRSVLKFYTDRPNSENCKYIIGVYIYDSTDTLIEYKLPTDRLDDGNIFYLDRVNSAYVRIGIAEYNTLTSAVSALRIYDFNGYEVMISVIEDYNRTYEGDKVDVNPGKYNIWSNDLRCPSAASLNASSSQGFALYNGILVQMYSDSGTGKCALVDMSDNSVIASFTSDCDHGNSIDFFDYKYDESDDLPVALVSDGLTNKSKICRIQTSGITVLTDLRFTQADCGFYASTALDKLNNIAYTIGYYANSYTNPSGNKMVIAKWDLSALTDNGDGTYTPALLDKFHVPFFTTLQGPTYHAGKIFAVSSKVSDNAADTTIYVIDPGIKSVISVISDFYANVKNKEQEAIYFYKVNGKYVGYIGNSLAFYTLDFN